jgi:hypothetical protein
VRLPCHPYLNNHETDPPVNRVGLYKSFSLTFRRRHESWYIHSDAKITFFPRVLIYPPKPSIFPAYIGPKSFHPISRYLFSVQISLLSELVHCWCVRVPDVPDKDDTIMSAFRLFSFSCRVPVVKSGISRKPAATSAMLPYSRMGSPPSPVTHTTQAYIAIERFVSVERLAPLRRVGERYAPYPQKYLKRKFIRLLFAFICHSLATSACHPYMKQSLQSTWWD